MNFRLYYVHFFTSLRKLTIFFENNLEIQNNFINFATAIDAVVRAACYVQPFSRATNARKIT